MKRELLAATAALMICATSAFAGGYELQCNAPQTLVGEDANDRNPVQRIAVDYSWDDHAWRVFHQLRSGAVVSRQVQYGITDTSNSIKTQWQGKLLRQPWLFMIGEIKKNGNEFVYHEWMYDTKRGNALVMQAMAQCAGADTFAQSLPTPTARLDAPTQPYAQAPAIPHRPASRRQCRRRRIPIRPLHQHNSRQRRRLRHRLLIEPLLIRSNLRKQILIGARSEPNCLTSALVKSCPSACRETARRKVRRGPKV